MMFSKCFRTNILNPKIDPSASHLWREGGAALACDTGKLCGPVTVQEGVLRASATIIVATKPSFAHGVHRTFALSPDAPRPQEKSTAVQLQRRLLIYLRAFLQTLLLPVTSFIKLTYQFPCSRSRSLINGLVSLIHRPSRTATIRILSTRPLI